MNDAIIIALEKKINIVVALLALPI